MLQKKNVSFEWQAGESTYTEAKRTAPGQVELVRVRARMLREKRRLIRTLRLCANIFVLTVATTSSAFLLPHWQQQHALPRLQATVAREAQVRQTQDRSRLAEMIDPDADAEWHKELLAQTTSVVESSDILIQQIALIEDIAVVELGLAPSTNQPRYRFYRDVDGLWLRTFPSQDLWGEVQSLELAYISFSYRMHEAELIAATAPILDQIYPKLYQMVGLELPSADRKLHIEPQIILDAETKWTYYDNHLRVPSYLVSATLAQSDPDAFMQPLLAAFARDALYAALEEYKPASMTLFYAMFPALRDWLIVEAGGEPRAWADETNQLLQQRLAQEGMLRLRDLEPQANESTAVRQLRGRATQSVINYIAENYGNTIMPILLRNLGTYTTWPDLIIATCDVSLIEFEAGWNRFLREQE